MVWLSASILFLSSAARAAEISETFEGPDPTWTLAESDCQAQAVVHQRRLQGAHTGQGCEYLRIQHGQGSAIYLAHRIDPSPVIEEWLPSVWVKSDQPGIQLLARVIFPRTLDPRSGKPLSTFLFGKSYDTVSVWQQLVIDKPILGLERQVRALRSQWGPNIDPRQAYVDLLVLNVYTGPTATQVWIDDLEVRGHVDVRVADLSLPLDSTGGLPATQRSAAALGHERPAAGRLPGTTSSPIRPASYTTTPGEATASGDRSPAPIRLQGSVLTVANRPLSPRIARWRGEPFDWLQELGFNTLLFHTRPTREQRAETARLGMWLIVPPPALGEEEPLADAESGTASPLDARLAAASPVPFDEPIPTDPLDESRVLAWNLGADRHHSLAVVARRATLARQLALDRRRPLLGSAADGLQEWSRAVDVLSTDLWSPARILGPASPRVQPVAVDLANSVLADVQPGVPVWAEIHLPRLPDLPLGQEPGTAQEPCYSETDLVAVRQSVYRAIADGARGFVVDAPDSLEPGRGELRPLLSTIRTLNAELALLEPWIAASQGVDDASVSHPRYQVRVLHNDRSRLAIVLRQPQLDSTADTQRDPGRRSGSTTAARYRAVAPLTFVDPGATSGMEAYEITPGSLRPLQRQRVAGGVQVKLENEPAFALVVLTQEPIVVNYLARRLATNRGSPSFR
ncbi:MAG: hypothetical protein U0935_07215 [Pirellulales bacterium]